MHKHGQNYTESQSARNRTYGIAVFDHLYEGAVAECPACGCCTRVQTEILAVNIVTPRYLVDIRFGKRLTRTVA